MTLKEFGETMLEPYTTTYMAFKLGALGWSYGQHAEMQLRRTGVTVHDVNPGTF